MIRWTLPAVAGCAFVVAAGYLVTVDNPEPALPDCPTDRTAEAIRCAPLELEAEPVAPLIGTTPAVPDSPVVCAENGHLIGTSALSAAEAGLSPCGPAGPPAGPLELTPTTLPLYPDEPCLEDEPCWDCETMGNRICGPGKP